MDLVMWYHGIPHGPGHVVPWDPPWTRLCGTMGPPMDPVMWYPGTPHGKTQQSNENKAKQRGMGTCTLYAKWCLAEGAHNGPPEMAMLGVWGSCPTAPHFWTLSLTVLYGLMKTMFARDTSMPAGSEARGEGRERGNFIETTSKLPVAQRAGGIVN